VAEEVVFRPQPKQGQFHRSAADIVVFGGAAGGGKTWSLLYEPTYHTKNPRFAALMFRRTMPQIYLQGGMWDTSEELYPYAGAVPSKARASWTFPSGATVAFRSMERDEDRYTYDGSQIPLICFDQLEHFSSKQFFYMLSRNRSTCGVRPYVRASANPQPGWLAEFLQWWWDPQTGYAIPERSGKVRWMARIGDGIRWYGSREEAVERHPGLRPLSVTFIFSKLEDNRVLMEKDPGYLANLMALPLVERERLLGGNWKIAVAGNVFKREWWKFVDRAPPDVANWCRFWDFAATEPSAQNPDPDWTAGPKLGEKDGQIYVADCRHFRGSPLTNEQVARNTAMLDGVGVKQRMEQEPGASGKAIVDHYARSVFFGLDFAGVPSLKKKLLRWAPLSAAAEQGRVHLVRGDWNADFVDELEACKGEDEKNDQADGASGALEALRVPDGSWGARDVPPPPERRAENLDAADWQPALDDMGELS